jgi:SET domain-containing protein
MDIQMPEVTKTSLFPALNRLNDRVSINVHPKKGRCVIAKTNLRKNQIIAVDPVIVLTLKETGKTALNNYTLWWKGRNKVALGLGITVLINHGKDPNVCFKFDIKDKLIGVYAKRSIEKGEELLVDYKIPLWFDPVED